MKYMAKTASAVLLVGCVFMLSGCQERPEAGSSQLVYVADKLPPESKDTSAQTMYQPEAPADPLLDAYAAQYDKTHAKTVAPVKAAAKPAAPAPKADPVLAAKEDIEAAKKRIAELRGSVKTTKNGAITAITVESADATLDDMKLFGRLLDLESISFLGSNFTDEYLAQFKDLKKIKSVTVQNASITGATLEMLTGFPELTTLDIRRDLQLVNKDLGVVANMPKLEKLAAYYNSFSSIAAKRIATSPSLKVVDLRACSDVSDSAAKYLATMPTLEEVYFRFLITNDGVEKLAEAPALKFIELQDCPIDNGCADALLKFPALTGVRVFRSKAFDDAGVQKLASLKLERLELRDLNVSNAGVLPLAEMTSLKSVELSELSNVDAEALKTVCTAWKDIETLNFFSMSTDDEVVKTLCSNMKNLKSLTLRASVGKLTDASIDEIVKLENLTTLDLRENAGFTVDGMMKLANMKNLRKIYIKGTVLGDSSAEIKAKLDEFKKINPKVSFSN